MVCLSTKLVSFDFSTNQVSLQKGRNETQQGKIPYNELLFISVKRLLLVRQRDHRRAHLVHVGVQLQARLQQLATTTTTTAATSALDQMPRKQEENLPGRSHSVQSAAVVERTHHDQEVVGSYLVRFGALKYRVFRNVNCKG